MSKIYTVSSNLYCSVLGSFELPEGVKFENLKDWYVKWDTLYYTIDGDEWFEFELSSNLDSFDSVDWKRPISVSVYDEAGNFVTDKG